MTIVMGPAGASWGAQMNCPGRNLLTSISVTAVSDPLLSSASAGSAAKTNKTAPHLRITHVANARLARKDCVAYLK